MTRFMSYATFHKSGKGEYRFIQINKCPCYEHSPYGSPEEIVENWNRLSEIGERTSEHSYKYFLLETWFQADEKS